MLAEIKILNFSIQPYYIIVYWIVRWEYNTMQAIIADILLKRYPHNGHHNELAIITTCTMHFESW